MGIAVNKDIQKTADSLKVPEKIGDKCLSAFNQNAPCNPTT
jgi:hypothetical protein